MGEILRAVDYTVFTAMLTLCEQWRMVRRRLVPSQRRIASSVGQEGAAVRKSAQVAAT
jgi:hypothetical protein